MPSLRFIMIGGFLGAGKTTTLARLARHYMDQGLKVGLVTNDQAQDLVDTHNLREQGFPVEEVAGACFCCKFEELMDKVSALQTKERPDILLAEPVGSCTDLVATVVQPLKDLYGGQFSVAPYAVLFKPSHGLKILRKESGFSPKAAYIFHKQLEEADLILLNRIDELSPAEVEVMADLVALQYSGTPIFRVSAKTGEGFFPFLQLLNQEGGFGRKILDIDYDTYAEGEAELGWLNCTSHFRAKSAISLDHFLLSIIAHLQKTLASGGAEVAHLKAIGLWEGFFGVANLVSSHSKPELSLPSNCQVKEGDIVVNARVAMDPGQLQNHVQQALASVAEKFGGEIDIQKTQSFRPGRPTPTHRYAVAN